jgi:hypothetical protein
MAPMGRGMIVSNTQSHDGEEKRYLSYLLRLWRVRDGQTSVWRASIQSPLTGERLAFASLEEVFAFLRSEIAADQDPGA